MAGKKRLCVPGKIHYIYTKSIKERDLFVDKSDESRFLDMLKKELKITGFECLQYELSKNSYKLVIKINQLPLCALFRPLNSKYALSYNKRHARVGHLFHRRFKSVPIDEQYKNSILNYLADKESVSNSGATLNEQKEVRKNLNFDISNLLSSFPDDKDCSEFNIFEAKIRNIERETEDQYDPYCWSIGRKRFMQMVLSGFQEKYHPVAQYTITDWTLEKTRDFVLKCIPVSIEEFSFRGRLNNQSAARKLFSYLSLRKLEYKVVEIARFLKVSGTAISKLAKGGCLIAKKLNIVLPINQQEYSVESVLTHG